MWNQSLGRVAILFQDAQACLYAYAMQTTLHYLTVQLASPPPSNPALMQAGTRVQIVFEEKPTILHDARLCQWGSDLLTLQWIVPLPQTEKRRHVRYTCDIDISYRSVSGSNIKGAWQTARCVDISQGGMGLQLAQRAALPEYVQLWLPLQTHFETATRVYTDDGVGVAPAGQEAMPLRLGGRVLFPRSVHEAIAHCGVAFLNMSPENEQRLIEFLRVLVASI